MNIADRIKEFLNSRKIAVTQFADNCDVPRPTMSQLINGRNKKVSDELIRKIHQAYPDLSVIWLMFGEGPMMAGAAIPVSQPNPQAMRETPLQTQMESTLETQMDSRMEPMLSADKPVGQNAQPPKQSINFEFDDPGDDSSVEIESDSTSPSVGQLSGVDTSHRRIVSIIVYYSDNSYESFGPVPAH